MLRYANATVVLSLSLAVLIAGCGDDDGPRFAAPQVTVTKPVRQDVTPFVEFTGTTRSIAAAEVRARVAGRLESMAFTPSSVVQKGDLLFVIEREQYQAARDEADAGLRVAQARLALAESDLERIKMARESEAVSEQDLDRAVAQRDQAEAQVMSAEAQLSVAELNYSYTLVRSPITGQVSRRLVDIGNLVGGTEQTLLTTVNAMQPIFVYFEAPERTVLNLLALKAADVAARPESDTLTNAFVATAIDTAFPHVGKLDYIDNTVDPTTGTIQIRAVLPNDDLVLFPGLFVRVRIPARMVHDALLIDERAIGTDLGGKYVYVVDDSSYVDQRYITIGYTTDDGMALITQGLDGTETYIVNGVLRARPGFPVAAMTEEEVAARQAAAVGSSD
jgi:RND family efflux transporter MFP subunit